MRSRQNLSDVRLKTCAVNHVFISGHSGVLAAWGPCECTWKYRSISSNSPAQLEIKDNKRGEIWMSLITCGSIHEGHQWFSNDSQGRQQIFVLCE